MVILSLDMHCLLDSKVVESYDVKSTSWAKLPEAGLSRLWIICVHMYLVPIRDSLYGNMEFHNRRNAAAKREEETCFVKFIIVLQYTQKLYKQMRSFYRSTISAESYRVETQ